MDAVSSLHAFSLIDLLLQEGTYFQKCKTKALISWTKKKKSTSSAPLIVN